ncbi:hypothetical protein HMN09_00795900 [Mycena chlorophos]|uniref:Uncharacterized protein n=1 Tax=Mycena chlorophos TaxID=658473 RepID=A0A8H6W8E1_MYCCL|nr:hypothetical protein HMN09_00795900 [Mycena chlorophos]
MGSAVSVPSTPPPGENAQDLWLERSNLDGFVLSGVFYGILSTIAFNTLSVFFKRKQGGSRENGLIAYVVVTFLLATVAFATNAKFNEQQYIDDRGVPGGPNAFGVMYYNSFYNMFAFIAYIVMGWMTNGLMLWRFNIIWGRSYWFAVFPACMFLGIITCSILLVVSLFLIANPFWAMNTTHFAIGYWSLSISLNIILTSGIILRIWAAGRRIQAAMGQEHGQRFVSIAAMLIESAALYAIWSLVFLICYARGTPLANILLSGLGQIQGIAPLLILFRVAQGSAWTQDTANTGPMTFEHPVPGVRRHVHTGQSQSHRSYQLELGSLSPAADADTMEGSSSRSLSADCESGISSRRRSEDVMVMTQLDDPELGLGPRAKPISLLSESVYAPSSNTATATAERSRSDWEHAPRIEGG